MSEPTLKDVLQAIAKLDAKVDRKVDEVDRKVDELRSEVGGLRSEVGGLRSEVGGLRAEMTQRFDELDAELTLHAKVHRKIEDDITTLKARPPRTAARPARRPRTR